MATEGIELPAELREAIKVASSMVANWEQHMDGDGSEAVRSHVRDMMTAGVEEGLRSWGAPINADLLTGFVMGAQLIVACQEHYPDLAGWHIYVNALDIVGRIAAAPQLDELPDL